VPGLAQTSYGIRAVMEDLLGRDAMPTRFIVLDEDAVSRLKKSGSIRRSPCDRKRDTSQPIAPGVAATAITAPLAHGVGER
jgi:hypothetical protein